MSELIDMILRLSDDIKIVKAYLQHLGKNKVDQFRENWIDGQDVMQALHISKRTLQSLRDSGVLPYSRINGKFYYKVEDIETLLESNYSGKKSERRSHGNH
ncbi:helix-turn-helix domain-containing protein [Fulvivirga sp.]|uniref:helix-turn-helix domain-containing protein n=1 Tax=Fulvivirga sp. TaxID=1931237 RepID=UPI0032ED412F